jgi:hypothetical protein
MGNLPDRPSEERSARSQLLYVDYVERTSAFRIISTRRARSSASLEGAEALTELGGGIALFDLLPDGLGLGLLLGEVGVDLPPVTKHVGERGVDVREAQRRERLDDFLG